MSKSILLFSAIALFSAGCARAQPVNMEQTVDHALTVAKEQSVRMARSLEDRKEELPYSIQPNGELKTCDWSSWVSGFFPGTLWYLFEEYQTPELRQYAEEYTARVENAKNHTGNHDTGFMVFCSFGNGYRLTKNPDYLEVIETGCESLCTRYDETIGCIRSWDWGSDMWNYPVIIDNMMNLEMLLWGGEQFDNQSFIDIAISHADVTMKHHFREDSSSYHVVSYNDDGSVELKRTWQGCSDDSAWARGQGWGLYGYTMMYRFTKNQAYLDQAVQIAEFIANHPNLPDDGIPYWDFNAPDIPNALRDSSAGALIASALLELSGYVDDSLAHKYMQLGETQLRTLCSPEYLAVPGTNHHFILKHAVGNIPDNNEIDVPLNYADYYFVEALLRYKQINRF